MVLFIDSNSFFLPGQLWDKFLLPVFMDHLFVSKYTQRILKAGARMLGKRPLGSRAALQLQGY